MTLDPLRNFPGYALRRASSASIASLARDLAQLDIRLTEGTVLLVIEANPGISQSDVGRLLDIASANMAPLAARLLQRDLIVREKVDGRSHGIRLSERGHGLAARIATIIAAHEAELWRRIPAQHHQPFLDALHALWAPKDVQ